MNEIEMLQQVKHDKVIKLFEAGNRGRIVKPLSKGHGHKRVGQACDQKTQKEYTNLYYLLLEYVPGGNLFDLCERNGAMGEDVGRFFLS